MYHAIESLCFIVSYIKQFHLIMSYVIVTWLFQLFYLTPNWRSAFEMGPVVHNDSREMKTASKQSQPLDGIK
ncbi:hypothetical protein T09_11459 [Trichinella sp. T9]|nr:hypothetical protein T09_11459 [Trichinella sp. T9]